MYCLCRSMSVVYGAYDGPSNPLAKDRALEVLPPSRLYGDLALAERVRTLLPDLNIDYDMALVISASSILISGGFASRC